MGDLASRLKHYRVERQLSVRELAKQAGVSASYIYAIEAGVRGHNIDKLGRIADALGITLSALWGEDPSP